MAPSGSQIWNYKTESISGSVVPLAMFISKNRERKKSSFESRIGSKKPILLRNWSYITEERDIADIRMQKQANDNL